MLAIFGTSDVMLYNLCIYSFLACVGVKAFADYFFWKKMHVVPPVGTAFWLMVLLHRLVMYRILDGVGEPTDSASEPGTQAPTVFPPIFGGSGSGNSAAGAPAILILQVDILIPVRKTALVSSFVVVN